MTAAQVSEILMSEQSRTAGQVGCLHVQVDGDWQYDPRKSLMLWRIDLIDDSNKSGSMEFVVPVTRPESFFPVNVSFQASKTLCQVRSCLLQGLAVPQKLPATRPGHASPWRSPRSLVGAPVSVLQACKTLCMVSLLHARVFCSLPWHRQTARHGLAVARYCQQYLIICLWLWLTAARQGWLDLWGVSPGSYARPALCCHDC